jgi:hypothetical protein
MFLPLFPFLLQYVDDNLGVMSVGFLLSSPDDAVIWRGPKKNGLSLLPGSDSWFWLLGRLWVPDGLGGVFMLLFWSWGGA